MQGLINILTENMQTKGLATCHYRRTLPKVGPKPEPGCMPEPQDLLLGKQQMRKPRLRKKKRDLFQVTVHS